MFAFQGYLFPVLCGLAAALATTDAIEFAVPEAAAVSAPGAEADASTVAPRAPKPDLNALVGVILARPLFTASRRPPPPPSVAADDNVKVAMKPPDLEGRLAGMVITPNRREAIFAREGERPLAVTIGETVGGWTVRAIEPDRVVLTSDFGEKIVEPTPGVRGEGVVERAPQRPPIVQVRRPNTPTRTAPPPRPPVRRTPGQVGALPGVGLASISRTAQNGP